MKRKRTMVSAQLNPRSLLSLLLVATQFWLVGGVSAQTTLNPVSPTQFDVTGFIQAATLDDSSNPLSGGTITVNNQKITVPKNTILQMPAAALTWWEVFSTAPAPYGLGSSAQSGLALRDSPRPSMVYEAHVAGNHVGESAHRRSDLPGTALAPVGSGLHQLHQLRQW